MKNSRVLHVAISIMVGLFVFYFVTACGGYNEAKEEVGRIRDELKEVEESSKNEEEEEEGSVSSDTELIEDEDKYLEEIQEINSEVVKLNLDLQEDTEKFLNEEIDFNQFREEVLNYKNGIGKHFDRVGRMDPLERFSDMHSYFSQALEHYYFAALHLEALENENDVDNMEEAAAELELGAEYLQKATEEVNKISGQ